MLQDFEEMHLFPPLLQLALQDPDSVAIPLPIHGEPSTRVLEELLTLKVLETLGLVPGSEARSWTAFSKPSW